MLKYLKIELKRAFFSKNFIFSFSFALFLVLWQYFEHIYPIAQSLKSNEINLSVSSVSVFNTWIGSGFFQLQQYLYFLLLPLIATFPYGNSFCEDLQSGLIKNILIKTKRKHYIYSKYIAVMISAGCCVTIPLIINLLLTASCIPSITPTISSSQYSIFATSMWAKLFYTKPYLYTIRYLLIIFVFSGLIASVSLGLSKYIKNKITITFAPFLIYLFAYVVLNSFKLVWFSPFNFLPPSQPVFLISINAITLDAILLIAFNHIFFINKYMKEDIL